MADILEGKKEENVNRFLGDAVIGKQVRKGRLQKQKTILRGNFSHVGRPPPAPPVWERPCQKYRFFFLKKNCFEKK